jgi:hypothetical protein
MADLKVTDPDLDRWLERMRLRLFGGLKTYTIEEVAADYGVSVEEAIRITEEGAEERIWARLRQSLQLLRP